MPNIRQDSKAAQMYSVYKTGLSLDEVAANFGITRQSVFVMFKRRNFELREKPAPLPFVMFNGFKYTLRNTGYFGKTNGDRTLLHRDMWEAKHGKIPPKHDIHHKDFNKTHNVYSNFMLLTKAEHARRFKPQEPNREITVRCRKTKLMALSVGIMRTRPVLRPRPQSRPRTVP